MRLRMILLLPALAASVATASLGCSGEGLVGPYADAYSRLGPFGEAPPEFSVVLSSPAHAPHGSYVPLRLTITNRTDSTIDLDEIPGMPADFFITHVATGSVVWEWRDDVSANLPDFSRGRLIQAGDSVVFTGGWGQRDLHGRRVPRGLYEVRGVYFGSPVDRHIPDVMTEPNPLRID